MLPFEDGLKRERALFLECMASPQRAGLIHAFFGEREVAKVPGLPAGTPIRPLQSVAVIGAGTMGGGIATCFANIGIPVTLLDSGREALDKGEAAIRRAYEGMVHKGRLTLVEMESRLTRIRPALSGQADSEQALAEADVIVEAVFEDLAVKREIFARLDAVCKPGAILATNTSTLDVNAIAAATHRPQDVIGLHFFSPANVMRLLEVVRAEHTADDVLATAMALAKRIGKSGYQWASATASSATACYTSADARRWPWWTKAPARNTWTRC
jgi:3-hydroxyacyl-CoA dehydrogenase